MGRLVGDQGARTLSARTLVGRSTACHIQLSGSVVSGEHATIHWNGHAWLIRDLGSKNGTFVDNDRIEPGKAATIDVGARIGFGEVDGWILEDASAPCALARRDDGAVLLESMDGVLVLPDAEHPAASIYQRGDGLWVVETEDGDLSEVKDAQAIRVGDHSWQVDLPGVLEGTPLADGPRMETTRFCFRVSRDEEHVELDLQVQGRTIPLDAHEHHYVLLTLARLRERDAERPVSERGWIDREELLKMLAINANTLDVAICRARRKIARAGIEGAAGVVEVRPRQRRFGTDNFDIRTV